jgi:hypothetical protein
MLDDVGAIDHAGKRLQKGRAANQRELNRVASRGSADERAGGR